jgi:serine/threonine protein kinase
VFKVQVVGQGRNMALKQALTDDPDTAESNRATIVEEAALMQMIPYHENVVPLLAVFLTQETRAQEVDGQMQDVTVDCVDGLLLEYCKHGDLLQYIEARELVGNPINSEEEILDLLAQVRFPLPPEPLSTVELSRLECTLHVHAAACAVATACEVAER